MRSTIVLAALLALPLALPSAAAASCTAEPAVGSPSNLAYAQPQIAQSRIVLWHESNGVPGLQTTGCTGPDGLPTPADTHVATVPIVNCVGSICIL